MFIEEEWFDNNNLTDGAYFLTYYIKRSKTRFNEENIPRDTQ